MGLGLVLVLSGCTGAGDRVGNSDASDREQTPVVEPPGASPSGTTGGPVSVDVNPELGLYTVDPATGEADLILSGAEVREPERSPDGSQLVYQSEGPRGIPQIFVLQDGTSRQLTHMPGGASEPTWSPDGTRIAFAGAASKGRDSDIFVVEANGGRVRLMARTDLYDRRPDWSPDGTRIVFDTYGDIWVVSVHDGELARLQFPLAPGIPYPRPGGPAADPIWSPDGRWIAFTRHDPHTINGVVHIVRLWIVRSDGTDERPLLQGKPEFFSWQVDPSWAPDGNSIAFVGAQTGSKGFATPAMFPSVMGVIDMQTGEVAHMPISLRVLDLSWDTEGLLASVGDRAPPSPPIWGVTDRRTQDPWPDVG